jgi:glutamate transport system substrate-binding protein
MTPEREQVISFAGPYLTTRQRVLTPARRSITSMDQLSTLRARLCTSAGSTSEKRLSERKVTFSVRNTDHECFDGMNEGRFDAMSSDETVLAGLAGLKPGSYELSPVSLEQEGDDTSDVERLGIGVQKDNKALKDLVNHVLTKSYRQQESRTSHLTAWQQAYDTHLADMLGERKQQQPDEPTILPDYDSKDPGR